MHRPLARLLIGSALVLSIGLHWVVLQSAAWAGMIVSYSLQQGSLVTGVSQTFDNEHPCPLCSAIKKGTQSEKKDTRKQEEAQKKLVLALELSVQPVLTPPTPSHMSWECVFRALKRDLRPPSPPPRRGGHSHLVG